MEIAVIILSFLLIMALCALAATIYEISYKLKRQNEHIDKIITGFFDYRMVWNDDLSRIEFSESLTQLLAGCGIKAGADYLHSVFGSGGGVTMCVNALKKSGVSSEYTTVDGSTGIILWKSSCIAIKNKKNLIFSFGRDVSDEIVSKNVVDRIKNEFIDEFSYIDTAVSNAQAGVCAIVREGDLAYIHTTPKMLSLLGFAGAPEISLEQLYLLMKKEEVLEAQRNFDCFIKGESNSINISVQIKTVSGVYHSFLIECSLNENASDYRRLRTGMIFDTTVCGVYKAAMLDDEHREPVTGLLNRAGFMKNGQEFLNSLKEKKERAILICIQVERMRKISILFGANASETLTKLYAEALVKLAPPDSVIGKVGAEDFALLFRCDSRKVADKLMKEIKIIVESFCNGETLPVVLKEQSSFLSGACFSDESDDITSLYNKASVTLFSGAKFSAGSCYYDKNIEKKLYGRDFVEREIGSALKMGELELYYQPKIGVKSGVIEGAEALMRWNHKTRGLIMPSEFIQVAEEMGIITKLDEWGMLQACIQNKIWQEKGYAKIKLSVNMSQAQLYQTDVVSSVKNALEESGADASCLEVELTETMAMIDIDRTISILNQLKKLGVSISMDDFGTGYSSLSSLKILPIDLLKIDRSLVYDIETNKTARCITKAIMDLGKAMNLTLLAEGVENEEQRSILEDMGCDLIQGFLYSKPQPAAMVEKLFLIPEFERRNSLRSAK